MLAGIKNVLIGLFVLLAISIIVFILLFLHPTVGDNSKTLRVRFTDIDKINLGTRVTYAGRPVGEVVAIEEIPDARSDRISRKGDVYVYELTLKVDSGVNAYNTDEIIVRTSGLLGERSISINPQPLQPGEKLYLINDQIIYADQAGDVEGTIKQFGALSKKFEEVLGGLSDTLDQIKREKIVEKVARSAQNIQEITETLNQPEKWNQTLDNVWTLSERAKHSWSTIDASLQNFYSLTERAHESWTTLDHTLNNADSLVERAHQSWTTLDTSFQNLRQWSTSLNTTWLSVDTCLGDFKIAAANAREFTDQIKVLVNYVTSGQGSIGKILIKDDLYLRLKSILHKGETVMNDVNHYGVLFHLNKGWQRVNARRLNLLNRLSSPVQFTMYFNDELDRISTSLSRVSMVLNETECYPQGLLFNPEFTSKFSELIQRVEGIEESLKMYNEQVVDQECPEECCSYLSY